MSEALKEARKAAGLDEVPVGAVAVVSGKVIARGHNKRETLADPTAHAEILCIQRAAKKLGGWRLSKVSLYSTLEPCAMCFGAIVHARIRELVYGAFDPKEGAVRNQPKKKLSVTSGVLEKGCSDILKKFFKRLR
jgi:tRNA(adenine34) deaminase